jgi:hypothetical protein
MSWKQFCKSPSRLFRAHEYGNRKAYQSIMDAGTGKDYLIRVIVNYSIDPARVVTVYRTSKIGKYWRQL